MAACQGWSSGCVRHWGVSWFRRTWSSSHKNNSWISNGNSTAWAFHCCGFIFVCKGFLFSVKDFFLQGFHQQSIPCPPKELPKEGCSGSPSLAHTHGNSSRLCRPGSPSLHHTSSSWECTCAAAGTRTRSGCSALAAPGTWLSRWVLHTQTQTGPGWHCHQQGPAAVPRSRLH